MQGTPYPYELILLDLDGTLIETGGEIADAVNDTLADLSLAPIESLSIERWIGMGTQALLARALALRWGMPASEAVIAEPFSGCLARFAHHYLLRCGTTSRVYPHVRPVLQALRPLRVRLAVLTNKEDRYTRRLLEAHGLLSLFDMIVSGDTYPTKKPDPYGANQCLHHFGLPPDRALLVGDSSIDVATARQADIPVWVLPYGYNMGEPIESCGADRVIPDFSALLPSA